MSNIILILHHSSGNSYNKNRASLKTYLWLVLGAPRDQYTNTSNWDKFPCKQTSWSLIIDLTSTIITKGIHYSKFSVEGKRKLHLFHNKQTNLHFHLPNRKWSRIYNQKEKASVTMHNGCSGITNKTKDWKKFKDVYHMIRNVPKHPINYGQLSTSN